MPKTKLSEKEIQSEAKELRKWHRWGRPGNSGGAIYFFGLIGSLVYFIQHAASFGDGLIGIVKAIGWPAVIVYKVLEMLRL